MDGDHSIEKCAEVTEMVLAKVASEMVDKKLLLEGCIIKPSMVTKGAECKDETTPEDVGRYTVRTLSRTIPAAVPGITFLSGGQSEEAISLNLSAINNDKEYKHPWNLSFSFGRALQNTTMDLW
jgi:fructose-bisphosphate aldolase class I